jgi:hypothetical protein
MRDLSRMNQLFFLEILRKTAGRTQSTVIMITPSVPFDWILAEVTASFGPYEFILGEPVHCPTCKHEITEKTLVAPMEKRLNAVG